MRKAELTEGTATRNCQRLMAHGWLAQRQSYDRANAVSYELTFAGAAFLRRNAEILAG